MPNTAAILKSLHALPPAALRELKMRATVLLGENDQAAVTDTNESDEYTVHKIVCDVLADNGQSITTPLPIILKGKNGKAFRDGAAVLVRFMDRYLKPKAGPDRQAALRALVRACATYARRGRRPLSHKTLCEDLAAVAQAVDSQYPGYRESGLLPAILKMRGGDCSDA